MFQVLMTSPEVLVEDLNEFESIGWEAIIVDECQRSKIFSHFEQIKVLSTDMRLLLVNGQLKDSIAEYLNMLSLLNSSGSDSLIVNSKDTMGGLKEKLLKYIAYEGKSDTSKFVEYWVPVQISDMQLEQYCSTLLSNCFSLCSPLKTDPVGVLRDLLISVRKCCDHPYLVDASLQGLLIRGKETEFLDVGIKASGKFQLLDTMLSEMKSRGLRVLILFQGVSGSKTGLGDILDDLIRWRFGPDSYERIDGNVRSKEKQLALNNFNKESGRFVFLLETRACLPSITLSSVDTIIIFNSDWSPLNDMRALQKITLDPHIQKIKIFRLYSSCTVEEKVLIQAKQDKTPDGYFQNLRPSTSHLLLMWGASYLFNRLNEFHGDNTPASSARDVFDQSFRKDVVGEFLAVLTQTGEDGDTNKLNKILEVQQFQNLGAYSTDLLLFGESKIEVMDDEAHIFWKNLLDGRYPRWKYTSGSTQRSRKRVQLVDDLQKKADAENDEVVKKHRKVTNNIVNQSSSKLGVQRGQTVARVEKGTSKLPAHGEMTYLKHGCLDNILEVSKELCYSQESLHLLLKPEMEKLCEVLKLKDDAKDMVEMFLEYVMINHRVSREPPSILQAFQISVCWTAASLLKLKIDHKESLALAKQYLNFDCKKEEADRVYSQLRCLKEVFLNHKKKLEVKSCPKTSQSSLKDVGEDNLQARSPKSKSSDLHRVKVEVEDGSMGKEHADKHDLFELAQKDIFRSIKGIRKKCHKQMEKVKQRNEEKKEGILRKYEEEKTRLENKKRTEVAFIRLVSQGNTSMQTDKLKKLDTEYAKHFEDLQRERDKQLKYLEEMLGADVNKMRDKEASWMKEVNAWLQGGLLHNQTFNKSGDGVQCLQTSEQVNARDNHENVVPASCRLSQRPCPNSLLASRAGGLESSLVNETWNVGAVACANHAETVPLPVSHGSISDEFNTVASLEESDSRFDRDIRAGSLVDGRETTVCTNPDSIEQILDRSKSVLDGLSEVKINELVSSSDSLEHGLSPVHISKEQISDGVTLIPKGVVPGVAKTVSFSDGLENAVPVNAPSSEKQVPNRVESLPNNVVLSAVPETDSSSDGLENVIAVNSSSGEQIPDITVSAVPDVEVVCFSDGLENVVPVNVPSSEKQVRDRVESMPNNVVLSEVPETDSSSDGLENVIAVNSSSGQQIPDTTVSAVPDEEVVLWMPENAGSGDNLEKNLASLSSFSEQIPSGTTCVPDADSLLANPRVGCSEPTTLTVPDEEVLLQVSKNVYSSDNLESDSVNPSSYREQIPDSTTCMPITEVLLGNLQSGRSEPVSSAVMQDGDAAANGLRIDAQEVEPPLSYPLDAGASDQSNHGAQETESLAQSQLLTSIDSLSGHNSSDLPSFSGIEHQPSSEYDIANQHSQVPTMMVENHVELSDLAVLQPVSSFVLNPPVDIPHDGLGTSTSDPRMASITPGYSNYAVQNAQVGASQFSPPVYRDPLQRELDRLRKETEDTIRTHEETKLRLKFDCDREIEEVVSQIRRKYEVKLQETEAEFITKKRELDANQNKVFMNKILADAFRSKCTAIPEVRSSFIQQRELLLSHQSAQRPSSAAPTVTMQTTVAPIPSLQTSLPAVSPPTGVQPVQAVHHSSALFSIAPTRPSLSNSVTSLTGNHQVGTGLSAPPHLRPFRPTLPVSSAGVASSVVPSKSIPTNPSATSPLLPLRPAQTSVPTSQSIPNKPPAASPLPPLHPAQTTRPESQSIPNKPPATSLMLPLHSTQTMLPAYQSLTHSRAPRVNTSSLPSLPNPSLSALQLLLDVSKIAGSNPIPPSSLPPQSDLHSSVGPSAQPEPGMQSGSGVNPVQNNGGPADVVCLSDDEQ